MYAIKEIDGGREIGMEATPDFVFLEAGGRSYIFDRALFAHAMRRLLGVLVTE